MILDLVRYKRREPGVYSLLENLMQKNLSNVLVVAVVLLISGCQSNPNRPGLFSSYPTFPSFSQNSSMGVTQNVEHALSNSGDPLVARVHVETNQNAVVLTGYVKKIRQSDFAEQLARQAAGGMNVQNNIIVRP